MAINSIDLDDDREEEELKENLNTLVEDYKNKRIRRNIENSAYYLTNDLIHRGLVSQGPLEAVSDWAIKPAFEAVTGYKISSYRSSDPADAFFNTLGIYGIVPAGFHSMFHKNSTIFSTKQEELEKKGYGAFLKADGEYGFDLPDGTEMPQELRTLNKAMQLMSIPAAFGIQDQFTSSITRTMPSLYKKMEDVVYRDIPQVSEASRANKFENKFKELNSGGKTLKLDDSEAKLFKKYYMEAYKESYQTYVDENKEFIGEGPKLEELAIKHLYKKAKAKLLEDKEFAKLWELKAKKN